MTVRVFPEMGITLKQPKGTWKKRGDGLISVVCPDCGEGAFLDHTVADDGTVTPSLVCSVTGCKFHEFVKLDGWKAGA